MRCWATTGARLRGILVPAFIYVCLAVQRSILFYSTSAFFICWMLGEAVLGSHTPFPDVPRAPAFPAPGFRPCHGEVILISRGAPNASQRTGRNSQAGPDYTYSKSRGRERVDT